MHPIILPKHGVYGVVEAAEPRPVTRIGVYNSAYLKDVLRVLECLEWSSQTRIEIAYTPMGNDLNALLLRPRTADGDGWIAVAPVNPECGHEGDGIRDDDEDESGDDDIIEVN